MGRPPEGERNHERSQTSKRPFSRSMYASTDQPRIALDSTGDGPGLVILPGSVAPPERYGGISALRDFS